MNVTSLVRCAGAVLMLTFGVLIAACATGGSAAGTEGGTALEVQNNLIPPTALSVYLVPEFGSRRLIGQVQPGRSRVIRFNPLGSGGQFRFAAETTFGREIVSNPVSVELGDSIRWDLSANIAVAAGR